LSDSRDYGIRYYTPMSYELMAGLVLYVILSVVNKMKRISIFTFCFLLSGLIFLGFNAIVFADSGRMAPLYIRYNFEKEFDTKWHDATTEEQEKFIKNYKIAKKRLAEIAKRKEQEERARLQQKKVKKEMKKRRIKRKKEARLAKKKRKAEKKRRKQEELKLKKEKMRQKIEDKRRKQSHKRKK